ncbi:MAG: NAD-dependent epimerase/dehydratase family protein [Candidatus Hodarchaeota archaeon]
MKKDLNKFFVGPKDNLKEVMKVINLNGNGVALVVDENNILLGIVTDGDIRRSIIQGTDLESPVNEIMNKNPVIIDKDSDQKPIFETIKKKFISHIPVVDKEKKVCDIWLRSELIGLSRTGFFPQQIPNKEKRILVIGGAGYIGSVLTKQLLDKGYSVRVLDKLLYSKESIDLFKEHKKFSFIQGDIGHVEKIVEAIKGADAVVQLAEIVGDPACAIDPQETQQVNYISTTLVANICRYFQINRFIYTSSCSVYGANEDTQLLNEESCLNPVSLYARMKIESEKSILNMTDDVFSPTILRLATVFGESPRMRFDLVVNILTAKAIKESKITVFGGDQWRPLVHVSDVARAIIVILESPINKIKGEVFNVGSNKNNFTINQIGELIKQTIPSANLLIEDKDVDKRNYRVDFSKIQNILNFQAKFSVLDGIVEISRSLQEGKYPDYSNERYHNYNFIYKNQK